MCLAKSKAINETSRSLFSLPLLTTCTTGFTVEYCWAAGEAVLIPYLLRHNVSERLVSTIYLSNPLLGLCIQPWLGRWSDRINRRVVFVVMLGVLAMVGLFVLLSPSIVHGFEQADAQTFGAATISIIFVGFGLADICFDCLLIPGRALLDDLAVPLGKAEEANALFTGFQLCGRLLALLIVSSHMTESGFWGLIRGEDGHFVSVLVTNVVCLVTTVVLVGLVVDDKGAAQSTYEVLNKHDDFIENDNEFHGDLVENGNEMDKGWLEKDNLDSENDCSIEDHNRSPLHIQQTDTSDNTNSHQNASICIHTYNLDTTVLICLVQAAGWMAITSQSFMWTSWRGEQIGSIDLALQGFVGVITTVILPFANKQFGAATVWLASELFFHTLMMSVSFINVEGSPPRIISALCGINYAIHATNSLVVAADVVADPSRRARTVALVNNALPMGQLVTASFGGSVAQYFGGFEYVFVYFGSIGAVVTGLVWLVSSRRGLFP